MVSRVLIAQQANPTSALLVKIPLTTFAEPDLLRTKAPSKEPYIVQGFPRRENVVELSWGSPGCGRKKVPESRLGEGPLRPIPHVPRPWNHEPLR